jgi:hypothetical protein
MDHRGTGETEIDQLAVDVGELHGNRRGGEPLGTAAIYA